MIYPMTKRKHIKSNGGKTKYFLKEKQLANIILAARGKSNCPAAKKEVKKLDKKYNLR